MRKYMVLSLVLLLCACAPAQRGQRSEAPGLPIDPVTKHLGAAETYFSRYKRSGGEQDRERAIGEYEKALPLIADGIAVKARLYSLIAERALSEEHTEDVDRLRDLLDGEPKLARAGFMPPSMIALAIDHPRLSKEQVKNLLRAAIGESPLYTKSYILLSSSLADEGMEELSVGVLRQAASVNPGSKDVHRVLGKLLKERVYEASCYVDRMDMVDEAIKAYSRALSGSIEDHKTHYALWLLYELRGNYDLQLFQARRMYELTGDSEDKLLAAAPLSSLGDDEGAVYLFEEMLAAGQLRMSDFKELGNVYFVIGLWRKAAAALAKYLEEVGGDDFYLVLKRAIAERALEGEERAAALLYERVDADALGSWEKHLYDFHIDRLSGKELIDAAADVCQKTEALYYAGLREARLGHRARAQAYFEKVLSLNAYGYVEYIGAKHQLARMRAR